MQTYAGLRVGPQADKRTREAVRTTVDLRMIDPNKNYRGYQGAFIDIKNSYALEELKIFTA
jgi:hypothetical protein